MDCREGRIRQALGHLHLRCSETMMLPVLLQYHDDRDYKFILSQYLS